MSLRISTVLLLLLVACRPDTTDLNYSFQDSTTHTYRMTARAEARWDLAGEGRGSYEVGFDVTETVESVGEDGAVVVVEMVPTGTEEAGLPSPGLERRSFSLRLGPNGEVLEVLRLDDVEASDLNQDELAFIGTYRPPLPEQDVALGDRWTQERQIELGSSLQEIEMRGELTGFSRDGRLRLARIAFSGEGPLEWITVLPQGEAQLTGDASTSGTALFDINNGSLQSAISSTRGDFRVRVLPGEGEAPIVGTLRLDLDLTVERVS